MADLSSELEKKLAEIVERHFTEVGARGDWFRRRVRAAVREAADAALERACEILCPFCGGTNAKAWQNGLTLCEAAALRRETTQKGAN